jgi:hypothetical protein
VALLKINVPSFSQSGHPKRLLGPEDEVTTIVQNVCRCLPVDVL